MGCQTPLNNAGNSLNCYQGRWMMRIAFFAEYIYTIVLQGMLKPAKHVNNYSIDT